MAQAAIPLAGSALQGLIGGLSSGGNETGGMLQHQPNPWANAYRDIGFGTLGMLQSALGNPMFASYLNQGDQGSGFRKKFGASFGDMGISPMQSGSRGGFGYTSNNGGYGMPSGGSGMFGKIIPPMPSTTPSTPAMPGPIMGPFPKKYP